jgi:hypothetical protein
MKDNFDKDYYSCDYDKGTIMFTKQEIKNSEMIFGETHYQTSAKFNKL